MSLTTLLLLVFTLANLALTYPLYSGWKSQIAGWATVEESWRYVPMAAAGLLLAAATLVWVAMVTIIVDAAVVELKPSRPKPEFLMTWMIGIFAYGIAMAIAQPLNRLAGNRPKDGARQSP